MFVVYSPKEGVYLGPRGSYDSPSLQEARTFRTTSAANNSANKLWGRQYGTVQLIPVHLTVIPVTILEGTLTETPDDDVPLSGAFIKDFMEAQ